METASFSVMELFRLGGVIMWPLLVFSIATVAISLERLYFIFYHNLKIDDLTKQISVYIEKNEYTEAENYLSSLIQRNMGSRILHALIKNSRSNSGFSEHRAQRAAETEAMNCINSLENGFNFLVAFGSLSPLTGFLGTVTGMIGAFRSIAEATEVNAQIVANGIYEALITTVFGLIIAIIAMISHSIFSHIVDKFAAKTEGSCTALLAQMAMQSSNTEKNNIESNSKPDTKKKRTVKNNENKTSK